MEGQVLSGKEFNRINGDRLLVKLTNQNENHNGFQFKTGLNVDNIPFNPSGECEPGGIYFCEESLMNAWLHYGGKHYGVLQIRTCANRRESIH
jgi:hypothetical protein